jgi:type IV pilus assembly protein PilN
MYSLDINFLNDRSEYKPDLARAKPGRAMSADSRRPLILGGLAALLFPAIAAGLLLFLQSQNARLEQEQADLDAKLGNIEAKRKEIANLQNQVKQTKEETNALASVFNQIKPWSAMMQDIRDRIPPGVQVVGVKQLPPDKAAAAQASPPPAAPAAGAPAAPPASFLSLVGRANSFNDVNDFMLVLQKSNFLKAKDTRLVKAELEREGRKLENIRLPNQQTVGNQEQPELPRQVQFEIQTALSDVPASELLRELDRKGASGLVTRIETLQQKGVIQSQ